MSWWAKYVGVPFADGGRTLERGLDCWGLVRLAYVENLGVELPDYGEISANDLLAVARSIGGGQEKWRAIPVPRALDVVLMRLYDRAWVGHVGVMIDGGRLLHTESSIAAAVVGLGHFTVQHRIAGFRRLKAAP